jgi:hypothetical protein
MTSSVALRSRCLSRWLNPRLPIADERIQTGVQGAATPEGDAARQREVIDAFYAASRGGDLQALVAVLDPEVVLRADRGAGASVEVRGAESVARQSMLYNRSAAPNRVLRNALINGAPGAVVLVDGKPFSVLGFLVRGGKIVEIDILADPARLARLDLTLLDG